MTAEEYYEQNGVLISMDIRIVDDKSFSITLMQEYAKLKCKELLEIVDNKINIRHTFISAIDEKITHCTDKIFVVGSSMFNVNKDSILNIVDLDSFQY